MNDDKARGDNLAPEGKKRKKRDSATSAAEHLKLRRSPAQLRGQATFEKILATAAQLLEDVGMEKLTTNLVSSESGVNISTIYQYFPNKHSIIVELFRRQTEQRVVMVRATLERMAGGEDWRTLIDKAIDQVSQSRMSQPGDEALRRAMRSAPDLLELDTRISQTIATWFADLLMRSGIADRDVAERVARIAVEINTTLLDHWESAECERDPAVLIELRKVIKAYLATYLD